MYRVLVFFSPTNPHQPLALNDTSLALNKWLLITTDSASP